MGVQNLKKSNNSNGQNKMIKYNGWVKLKLIKSRILNGFHLRIKFITVNKWS